MKNYLKPILRYWTCLILMSFIFSNCKKVDTEAILREKVEKYIEAWNQQAFTHPDFSEFKRDTSFTWHGKKEGKGIRSVFNPNSGWKQWDRAWNGTYKYEITQVDLDSLKVVGIFQETTDFLKFIGMPEGFKAEVSYWFDKDLKVKETLYAWDPNNGDIDIALEPIVVWAKENDSLRIEQIYLQNGFKADSLHASEWKKIFEGYSQKNTN